MPELNLKLYDIDGCLYHKYSNGGEIEPVENWLIGSNQKLWQYELQRLSQQPFSRVIVAYGINRQDKPETFIILIAEEVSPRSCHWYKATCFLKARRKCCSTRFSWQTSMAKNIVQAITLRLY